MHRKTCLGDLALFGGVPAFDHPLHVGQPNIGDRDALLARIGGLLDNRWLTNNGPLVQEFERRVAEHVGVKHCVAMCNGTVALEIAVRALGLQGEVIVPSFTFIATAHCLQWQQITPVFCDVDARTHTLDPAQIERLITPRTTGIVGVHLWGNPCAVDALQALAERHGLALLFDASHAFGCTYRGRGVGNFGRAEVFSFHATKFINAFEGGAVVTNDDELAGRMRLMKNFGFQGLDKVVYIGTNGKMSEPSAAMGLTSLEGIDRFIAHNYSLYGIYKDALQGLAGCRFYTYDEAQRCNYQYIVAEIDEEAAGISRDAVVAVLQAEKVRARRYFYPGCHRMEPYRSHYPNAGLLLPITNRLTRSVLCLPTGTGVSREEAAAVSELVTFALAHGREIGAHLAPAAPVGGD